ncbi:arginine decarboxylase, pyruvoyl-dependent [Candidatus Woesearchaeota archaeon CG10_big_fil_rev_8_21_14_0_10_44_13]|nr:MAG: arginine decarboxylase, pyruvoyl-dependent [Candidatus Woesearchaeota archaeon CG10_big_fil_rev_8_21_14_0_10_44_13]
MIPTKIFFTKGVGKHRERLASFEIALRDAGIQHCNLVNVSSIFPPHCKILSKNEGVRLLKPGQITFVVLARSETNEPNRLLAASIGLALPADPNAYGYLSEHHGFGQTEHKSGDYAEDLAAEMLASTLGVEFNSNKSYDELREVWKISDKIVNTRNITQSAVADKDGKWTTVIAAAVFICDEYQSVRDLEEEKTRGPSEKREEPTQDRIVPEIDTPKNGNGNGKKE